MKTDSLFYRIFKFDPGSLFRLIRLDVAGDYTFESITTKTTEKRLDGYLKPLDAKNPEIFLEAQGYPDNKIYWRIFREVCTHCEQNKSDSHFVAIVLFTDNKFDPGDPPLDCKPPNRLIRAYLPDCLELLKGNAGVLTALKPLALPGKKELREKIREWKQDIQSLGLPKSNSATLLELLEYAILQRFKNITLEEVRKMIELTPLEETVAGKELIQLGIDQGLKEGKDQGLKEGKDLGLKEGKDLGLKEGMAAARDLVVDALIEKFAVAPEHVSQRIRTIQNSDTLKALFRQILRCENIRDFETILNRMTTT